MDTYLCNKSIKTWLGKKNNKFRILVILLLINKV